MSERTLVPMDTLIKSISMGPFGSDVKVEYMCDEGMPIIDGSNLTRIKMNWDNYRYLDRKRAEKLTSAIAHKGDIIVTHRGTLGQLSYVPKDCPFDEFLISQSQFRVTLDTSKVNPIYFAYYFHTSEGQKRLLSFANYVGVPALASATTNFKELEFPLVNLSEQNVIADLLETIDGKIENNKAICSDLESMAKLIYDYWFLQFDFPDENGRPYKSSGGKMVWNKELKREIPEGWIVVYLKELTNCNQFSMSKQSTPNKIQYLDTANLTENRIDSIQELSIDDGYPSRAQRVVKPGDVLFSTVRPNQHHFGLVLNPRKNMIASSGFVIMSMKGDRKDNAWLYLTITNNSILRILESIANSSVSAYPSITPDDLANLQVAFPQDVEVMKKFSSKVMLLFQKSEMVKEENQQLASLRDFLLPMLMNGQVKVKS